MASIEDRLRIVPEFRSGEHDKVRALLLDGKLARRLSRWPVDDLELEISVKDRETSKQRMALECWIAKAPKMVATSTRQDLEAAVLECRDDLYKQVDKFITKKESERRR
jgi:ribosome-associated translation inhibitor RaiA